MLRALPEIIEASFDRVRYAFTILQYHIVVVIDIEPIRERVSAAASFLDERGRRLVAASEAFAAGYGGIAAVAMATGIALEHDRTGSEEIGVGRTLATDQVAGSRTQTDDFQGPHAAPRSRGLVEPTTRGDPESSITRHWPKSSR